MQQVSTPYPIVVSQAPVTGPVIVNVQPRQLKVNIKSTKGLGISNIVIGVMSILLGVAVIIVGREKVDFDDHGWSGIPGIIVGTWILVTGILGVKSSIYPNSYCYNWTSMSFNIVTCVAAAINVFIYAEMIAHLGNCRRLYGYDYAYSYQWDWFCQERNGARGCCITLLILHIVGFFVALSASILCCTSGCSTCCAYQSTPVIYQQQQPYIATSSVPVYVSSSGNPNPTMSYPVSQISNPNQTAVTQATHAYTNVTYSAEEPPQYQEKVPISSN